MTLTDDEVQRQIQIMVSFIDQEAKEKAEEIEAKAEEEFQIEKGRIVQQQRHKIQEHYEKKEKQLNQQKLVQHSHMLNRNRLAALKSRDDQIADVIEETKKSLVQYRDDPKFIENCITQALLQALESDVTIRCLADQVALVQGAAQASAVEYARVTGNQVQIQVDPRNHIPADRMGGILLVTNRGKLTIDNTLTARLQLIAQQLQPQIRATLFGTNPNRRFND